MQSLNLVKMFYVLAQLQICACSISGNKESKEEDTNSVHGNIAETGSETKSGQGSHGNQSAKTGEISFGGEAFGKNLLKDLFSAFVKNKIREMQKRQYTYTSRAYPGVLSPDDTKMVKTQKKLLVGKVQSQKKPVKAERDKTPDNMSKTGNPSTSGNHENADVNNRMFFKCQFVSTTLLYIVEYKFKVKENTLKILKFTFSEYFDDELFKTHQSKCRLVEAKNLHEQLLEFAIGFNKLALKLKNLEYIRLCERILNILNLLNPLKTKELVAEMAKTK